jgi:hypothetical protein
METFGIKVSRPTANLPQTTAHALFTITGGRVFVPLILGEVTTIIQTQANNTKLTYDPVDAGATQDLCAVLSITAHAVGQIFSITGLATDAMRASLNYGRGGLITQPLILKAGNILLDCAASNTGQVKWDIWYLPLDDGAVVQAA